jgi:hypothetical protein
MSQYIGLYYSGDSLYKSEDVPKYGGYRVIDPLDCSSEWFFASGSRTFVARNEINGHYFYFVWDEPGGRSYCIRKQLQR